MATKERILSVLEYVRETIKFFCSSHFRVDALRRTLPSAVNLGFGSSGGVSGGESCSVMSCVESVVEICVIVPVFHHFHT